MKSRSRVVAVLSGVAAASTAGLLCGMQGSSISSHSGCVPSLRDLASGRCVGVSSEPELGSLYPLGGALNVDALGRVGMGTVQPLAGLDVRPAPAGLAGIRAAGRHDIGGSGAGGAGVIALGAPPYGPGLLGVGAFFPGDGSAPGLVGHGGGDDAGGAQAGIEAFGGDGVGSLGGRGVVGHGGDASLGTFGLGGHGVVGIPGSGATPGMAIFGEGDFGGTGAKYFIQPHPGDPAREIRFVCLEGNESGTYFRGSARTAEGQAAIDVPEAFRLVTSASGLTVQVTAIGARADLWIESKDLQRIVVRSDVDVDFDYFVNGLRRGFEDVEVFAPNRSFVPEYRGEPFGTQYPEGLRRILVENGILEANFTPNEQTAQALGWELKDPEQRAPWSRTGSR